MDSKIKVYRLLVYEGEQEDVDQHLAIRGVKWRSPAGWDGGKVVIKERFLQSFHVEEKDSWMLAKAHLEVIAARAEVAERGKDWAKKENYYRKVKENV